ncbi:MAG: hypothetical protein L6R41_003131 [Letrouitia leprolyta]|nr:MAG: hypothetical protein L6R41_003131 [Letrouitia leprolyta]
MQGSPVGSNQWRRYWWYAHNAGGKQDRVTNDPVSETSSTLIQYSRAQHRTANVPRRIYVLGAGNIGGFVAHSLAGLPHPPPITLLLPSQKSLNSWHEQGNSIKLTTDGFLDIKSNIDVSFVRRPRLLEETTAAQNSSHPVSQHWDSPQEEIIHNLIVTVKALNTVDALRRVAHRLTQESSILFIQNGMGIIEEVNDKVFPDPTTRPQYMIGVTSHGIYQTKPFALVHSGHGTTSLAILPRNIEEVKPHFESSALYLLRTMTRTPVLAAVGFGPTDLLQLQLEKLAVNAVINPLTALMGCLNGELLYQPSMSRVIRLLLAEICLVIKSLPELQGVPNLNVRYDTGRLEAQVIGIANKTAANRSSMLQDINQGRLTEIEYISGYIIRRGEEVGIQCVLNYMVKHMIKSKERLEWEKQGKLLPTESRNPGQ